ncbi:tetratricopeptide repeat-containing protein [Blastococcus sp. PRF04-17]|uniref:tetratricopeptide repeat-containing protein n=1 Tax=Blastococcus sp. PRF04-17 TaxID=2933797 RepID=UPI001FF38BA6|nr:tetratricopeptide repeat-containing protein [Blastococcus sp. PRF04-17]UOY00187.1 patatin-like phospholipase family protein [Blastococcus sp. PRF04-17]
MDDEERARAVSGGDDASAAMIKELADGLRNSHRTAVATDMLTTVAGRALDGTWRPDERAALATVLRDHHQFDLARRLLSRVRQQGPDSEWLRQQHALCTYKDLELPAWRRLNRALEILTSSGPLTESTDAETLGIAGAIYKRRWEVDAKRVDLENALYCYRRGFAQQDHPERLYAGINAAFVLDQLAGLEDKSLGGSSRAEARRREADELRQQILQAPPGGDPGWDEATRGQAAFGLGEFARAHEHFTAVAAHHQEVWRQESTATQLATLSRLRGFAHDPLAQQALRALVGGSAAAAGRAATGKVGLALSGGGFRASLFHIGVLARLAECDVLRRVEVLSCVSGGSIVGAYYYLKLRELLQRTPDAEITDGAYVDLVRELAEEFLNGVRKNLRGQLAASPAATARMTLPSYSRTDRAGELFEEIFYSRLRRSATPWRMPDLLVVPAGKEEGFSLRYENWMRAAKVPVLVLNATTLNTGHSWQFTATSMGEPPSTLDARMDASRRLRRVHYPDAPDTGDLRAPALGKAVAASACVPGIFPPITISGLYDGLDVELVDGGVHDNQGVAGLLEQDCTVLLVSDASGQLRDEEDPDRGFVSVLKRSNDVLMKRVRGSQYGDLLSRVRAGTLRGFMGIHLTKGLAAPPRDWRGSREPWRPEDDETAGAERSYGIDREVQRLLAELRTDLDAFSDDEAYALMAAGYRMTEHDLADALPDHARASCTPVQDWPFRRILAEMTSGDASRLADSLRFGGHRFWRRSRAWNERMRQRLRPRAVWEGVRNLGSRLAFWRRTR